MSKETLSFLMETEGKKTLGFCPACISSPGGGRGRKEN